VRNFDIIDSSTQSDPLDVDKMIFDYEQTVKCLKLDLNSERLKAMEVNKVLERTQEALAEHKANDKKRVKGVSDTEKALRDSQY